MPGPTPPAIELAWQERGAGEPLVLIHGSLFDGATSWRPQLDTLAGDFRLIVPDRRGHGASPPGPPGPTIAAQAADVLQLLDRLDIATAHVAGASYGGLVALELAHRAPERLRSLVLVEPPYTGESAGDAQVEAYVTAASALLDRLSAAPDDAVAALHRLIDPAAGDPRGAPWWPAMVRYGLRLAEEERFDRYRLPEEALAAWEVPTLVVSGSASVEALRTMALDVWQAMPAAEFQLVPGAGHAAHLMYDVFNDRLRGFIAKSAR